MKHKVRPRKIKIVFVIDTLKGFAGTEKHLYDTIAHLNREVFSCYVIAFETREWMVEEFKKIGARFMTIPLERIYNLHALKQFFVVIRYLKEISPDIVQTFHFKSDTFGVLAAKASGVPCVISSRRDIGDMKKKKQLLLNRLMNRWIDRYIAVCEAVSKIIQEDEGVTPERIHVIYNGVNTKRYHLDHNDISEIRKDLNIPVDAFVVGIISNFRPEKDIPCFFKAMDILQHEIKNLRIVAAGCASGKVQKKIGEQMVQFCRENNLLSQTLFPGYVKNVIPHIVAMDVACLTPVKNEGFSNAILEEMALEKPVVATDVGGNAESVVDGETGFIIPPNNPEQLAKKILYLYRNKEQRTLMGKKARERVLMSFSLDAMIQNIESLYMSCCKNEFFEHK